MNKTHKIIHALGLVFISLILSACVSLAGYDQRAYENATSMKAMTLGTINGFGAQCQFTAETRRSLSIALETAYEYANGVQFNNDASKSWRLLIDDIVGGYFELCESEKGVINDEAFKEFQPQLSESFDAIICLEANKRSKIKCNVMFE